jgi:histidinol dehydrogenase
MNELGTIRFKRIGINEICQTRTNPVDDETLKVAQNIVHGVRDRGWDALLEYGQTFSDIQAGDQVIYSADQLKKAAEQITEQERSLLERTYTRITNFAHAQRARLSDLDTHIGGGRAGHKLAPVEYAACYAPGGRYPLPSSVLMTAATARAAGVKNVWVASPKPTIITLAAAFVAGADHLLAIGGAQAIAAFAYGAGEVPRCDVIVGPGNRWVTAAKQLVSGLVAIDMLAGPSELVVWADETAQPEIIAADLLAQAEHDPDALPVLVTTHEALIRPVESAVEEQLRALSTQKVARAAVGHGFVVCCQDRREAIDAIDLLAPEHLELQIAEPEEALSQIKHYGAAFIGERAAEVLGDYGAGPNHVLPTSGAARFSGGLSVLNFLRMRTWMQIDKGALSEELLQDSQALAMLEGLHGHARSAQLRAQSHASTTFEGPISLQDVLDAQHRIRPYVHESPLRQYATLNKRVGHGIHVWVKHENHLPTNAFKVRNGTSFITSLSAEQKQRGVIAATRGNHGQGVAWAGRKLGVKVVICVPQGNSPSKNDSMRALGASLIEQGADYDESVKVMQQLAKAHGYTVAHSTNDPKIIAGAGTMGLEMLEQCRELDAIVLSVGGGSQAVGTLTVIKALAPHIEVYGVQAANASAIHDSWHAKEQRTTQTANTFADGLATRSAYPLTLGPMIRGLADFVTVTDTEIAQAIQVYLTTTSNVAEGAGAAGLAGLIKLAPHLKNKKVAVVLSGSNIDADVLAWALVQ